MTIKNGDMPAMPIPNGANGTPWTVNDLGIPGHVFGLTKREHFAGLAAQGIVGNQEWMENAMASSGLSGSECVAKGAVNIADALLAELEKEES